MKNSSDEIINTQKHKSYFRGQSFNFGDEDNIKQLYLALCKTQKTTQDINVISKYLHTLNNFISFFKAQYKNFEEVIIGLSSSLSCEVLERNKILFKTGDKGDKFYIILKGKIAILIAKEESINMTERDYILYLSKLKKYHENELLQKCMQINRKSYPINDNNLLTHFELNRNPSKAISGKISLTSHFIDNLINFINKPYLSSNLLTEDYINRILPECEEISENQETKKVIIYKYQLLTSLKTGDKFGDLALDNNNQKRTATIITIEDCFFGSINKTTYVKTIKEANDKIKKSNIVFLINNQLFKNISNPEYFVSRFFNYFVFNKYDKQNILFKEDTKADDIYFIKNGEYEVSMFKNLMEINTIIKYLGGSFDEREENKHLYNNPLFRKMFYEKHKIKISIIKEKDIIGLEDIILDGKFICSVKCNFKGEAFKIEKRLYDIIISREKVLSNNAQSFINTKKQILVEKLMNIKNIRINSFNQKNSFDINKLHLERRYCNSSESKIFVQDIKNNISLTINNSIDNIKVTSPSKKIRNNLWDSQINNCFNNPKLVNVSSIDNNILITDEGDIDLIRTFESISEIEKNFSKEEFIKTKSTLKSKLKIYKENNIIKHSYENNKNNLALYNSKDSYCSNNIILSDLIKGSSYTINSNFNNTISEMQKRLKNRIRHIYRLEDKEIKIKNKIKSGLYFPNLENNLKEEIDHKEKNFIEKKIINFKINNIRLNKLKLKDSFITNKKLKKIKIKNIDK